MQIPVLSDLLRRNAHAGWFAICINKNGVFFAYLKYAKGKLPRVAMCAFHPVEQVTPAVLEKLRKDAHIPDSQFMTLLAPGEYQMLLVEAPDIPVDELKAAIRWRIKDSLSYHIDDATVDVLQIPASKNGVDRPQSLFAVAAPNNVIKKRIALFEKAKIDLRVVDIPEMAQRNIASLFEEGERGLVVLAFDDSGGILTITSEGELYFSRRIEITTGQLQDADEGLRQQYMERVELELHRSLDYFSRQFSNISIKRLLVSAPEQLGLVPMLAASLEVPVEQLDLAQVLDISAVPALADSEYAAQAFFALGAALRLERRVL
ncbi:MAG: agglutinin biogenesis protein MshI [Betaproteobacteria bacterium]|nr:agglutinin biogenesis protein MshI [Betaproteobacteria bacterium]